MTGQGDCAGNCDAGSAQYWEHCEDYSAKGNQAIAAPKAGEYRVPMSENRGGSGDQYPGTIDPHLLRQDNRCRTLT